MATFTLTLDTTGPQSPGISLDGGAANTGDADVVASLSTADGNTTGYQVKIYGDVDDSFAPSEYRADEADAPWVNWAATKNVRLSAGDGNKTVRMKIRDDVLNVSAEATDTITLDTSLPVPSITTPPDRTRISKIATRDVSTFGWQADTEFDEYKVKVVPSAGSAHTAGTVIGTTNGSSNVAGTAGDYPAETTITTEINGADLEAADAGDGDKVIKVFVKDAAGNWSV